MSRFHSASRDVPSMEYGYGTYAFANLGREWDWFRYHRTPFVLTSGMYGMIGLENCTVRSLYYPHELWRGLVGTSLSFSFDPLRDSDTAAGFKGEYAVVAGHESDHGDVREAASAGDIPNGGGGNFIMPQAAVFRSLNKNTFLTSRGSCKLFITGPFSVAPGIDCSFGWRCNRYTTLVYSLFWERCFPSEREYGAASLIRFLGGAVFPGSSGALLLYGSYEYGNGKGLLINRTGERFCLGVRYDPSYK